MVQQTGGKCAGNKRIHPAGNILPAEKWAVFTSCPVTRNITGKLEIGIHYTMYTETLLYYIH